MIGKHLAHLAGNILGSAVHIQRLRFASLKGHAVQFDMAQGAQRAESCIIDDHGVRLMLPDTSVKSVFFPVVFQPVPHAVEPEPTDLPVIGAEKFYTLPEIFQIFFEICTVGFLMPVQQRMIKERNDILTPAGVHKFPHQIAAAGMGRVQLVQPAGIVEGISVVMSGG